MTHIKRTPVILVEGVKPCYYCPLLHKIIHSFPPGKRTCQCGEVETPDPTKRHRSGIFCTRRKTDDEEVPTFAEYVRVEKD